MFSLYYCSTTNVILILIYLDTKYLLELVKSIKMTVAVLICHEYIYVNITFNVSRVFIQTNLV